MSNKAEINQQFLGLCVFIQYQIEWSKLSVPKQIFFMIATHNTFFVIPLHTGKFHRKEHFNYIHANVKIHAKADGFRVILNYQ